MTENFKKVLAIHDQVLGLLRSMEISPYPVHYKKYFDDLFLQIADSTLRQEQLDAEQSVVGSVKDDQTKHLDMAQRSVMSFVESHADISTVAQKQQREIEQASSDTLEEYKARIETLSSLNAQMSHELAKAQSKITHLTLELQAAVESLTIDPLTKVGNRSGFLEAIEPILEAGKAKKLSLVMMLIDIDDFKYHNEEYGHFAGDKMLFFVAQTIKSMIREGDNVYRYGGEEFAVVLNRCDETKAFELADKIRSKIEHANLIYSGKRVYVTVSVGVSIHQSGDTLERLMGRCDKALFCAKKSNKNCTYLLEW